MALGRAAASFASHYVLIYPCREMWQSIHFNHCEIVQSMNMPQFTYPGKNLSRWGGVTPPREIIQYSTPGVRIQYSTPGVFESFLQGGCCRVEEGKKGAFGK